MDDATRRRLARLSDPARTHTELARDACKARDDAIYEAYQANSSLREIAAATGLGTSSVHRIVIRQIADRQRVAVQE